MKRLADRDTVITYPVHTDPEHKLLLPSKDGSNSLYVVKRIAAASLYGGTYTDYNMVQPALIVVDKNNKLQQVWSWNTPPLDVVEPKVEMTPVASAGCKVLVGVRPTTSDIGASIKENRNVSVSGKSLLTIMKTKLMYLHLELSMPTMLAAGAGVIAVTAIAVYGIRTLL